MFYKHFPNTPCVHLQVTFCFARVRSILKLATFSSIHHFSNLTCFFYVWMHSWSLSFPDMCIVNVFDVCLLKQFCLTSLVKTFVFVGIQTLGGLLSSP